MSNNKIYIIDGYNILRSGLKYAQQAGSAPNFKDWDASTFNSAREALLNDAALIDGEVYIVYDGKKKSFTSNKVNIIFTDEDESADSVIEHLAYKLINTEEKSRRFSNPKITIVSNDMQIYYATSKHNVFHMSASAFIELIGQMRSSLCYKVSKAAGNNDSKDFTVENVVGKEMSDKLIKLRDSLLQYI